MVNGNQNVYQFELTSKLGVDDIRPLLPEGATVEHKGRMVALSVDGNAWEVLLISCALSIPAGVITNIIYGAIKKRTKGNPGYIAIDQTRIRFEEGKIAEFIQTKITSSQPNDGDQNPQKKEP